MSMLPVLHFTGSHSSAKDNSDAWRHVCGVYDVDNGGFLQFKEKTMYAITVKYKFESFNGATYARLAIARSGNSGNASYSMNPAAFGLIISTHWHRSYGPMTQLLRRATGSIFQLSLTETA